MFSFILSIMILLILLLNRKNLYTFILAILYMAVFFLFCVDKPDLSAYLSMYNYPEICTDFFYRILMQIFKYLGLNFFQFSGICFIAYLSLLGYIVYQNSDYPNYILGLYFITVFLIDNIQIRNFFGYMIVIYAIFHEFINPESISKKNYLKFSLLVLVAYEFHSVQIFYVSYLLIGLIKGFSKIFILAVSSLFFIPAFFRFSMFIFSGISWKLDIYFRNLGWKLDIRLAIYSFSILLCMALFIYIYEKAKKMNFEEKEYRLYDFVCKSNILNIFTIGLMLYGVADFFRISRNMLLLNYICFFRFYKKDKSRLLLFIMIICGMVQCYLYQISAYGDLFVNNRILNFVDFL